MEKELASVILGEPTDIDRFEIRHWGIKMKLSIKPLCPNQLIKMSSFLCRLNEIKDEEQTMFHAMTQNANDLKLVCHAIAIATNFPFKRFLYRAIMKLPLEDIHTVFNIVIKQSNATFFLNILALGKNLNLMKKKPEEQ
jgi:hypothetical protein